METLLTWLAVTLAALLVSAHARVNLPVLGPTSVLGLVALVLVLGLVAIVLVLARLLLRDGLRLRPRVVQL
jgi:hypothetical protein